jgi:hypothetical protein
MVWLCQGKSAPCDGADFAPAPLSAAPPARRSWIENVNLIYAPNAGPVVLLQDSCISDSSGARTLEGKYQAFT